MGWLVDWSRADRSVWAGWLTRVEQTAVCCLVWLVDWSRADRSVWAGWLTGVEQTAVCGLVS